ncbi:MAG: DUF4293 domain-containing protein [Bacteroides sp.]|nr:DUF4293 domain-containing protein [Ruminococcus flavefaciens]MCM1555764.1 DUF4293 domain-containing protein [Bacteroides sp.]
MIQRIQSVFLALAMLLTSLLFSFVLCDFHLPENHITVVPGDNIAVMKMNGFIAPYEHFNQIVAPSRFPLLVVLTSLLFILLAITLFSYRNRPRQIKLCTITFFVNIILLGYLFLSPDMISSRLSSVLDLGLDKQAARKMVHYQWASFFPLVSLIFVRLASRNIRKDENLVRSAERLR